MRDDNPIHQPTENQTVPLIEENSSLLTPNRRDFDAQDPSRPSLPPSAPSFQYSDKPQLPKPELPRSKPLVRGFERPSFTRIAILAVLCVISYPAFYILTLVAKDKSLSIVRLIVSAWCSGIGFALGYVILKIGAQHLEAASEYTLVGYHDLSKVLFQTAWATVIHMSYEGSGMELRDLARGSGSPTSFMPAFHIIRSRFGNREADRRSRKPYESVPRSSSTALRLLTLLQ